MGHGSLLPKHLFMGLAHGPEMLTISSLSVSSFELDSYCHILIKSNGGGLSSSDDSEPPPNLEQMFWKLFADPDFLAYAKRYWSRVIPNCGALSVDAMWMSSGMLTSLSSSLELPLLIFSISSFVFLTHS